MALYDPNELKTLERQVLAWAKAQPANKPYNYTEPRYCVIAQFGKACNFPQLVNLDFLGAYPILQDAARPEGDKDISTFGAFASRLEAALAK